MIEQANRLKDVPLSKIRSILGYANKLEAEGKSILHMEIGEPDCDSAKNINEAAKKAIDEGKLHYTEIKGIAPLREAIAGKLKRENGLDYTREEILVTYGVAHGIYLAIMAFMNEGDEILVPDPGYLVYFIMPKIAGVKIKGYSLLEKNGYQIDEEELRSHITDKTKMILLNSPNNPTGTVLNKKSLEIVAKIAEERDLIVLSDEIYEKMLYTGEPYISFPSLPGMKERTILLNGFSKYYAMTGWRLGYMAVPEPMVDPLNRLLFYNISCGNSFVQWAGIEALEGDQSASIAMVDEYHRRRDALCGGINSIDGLSCVVPEGAFYVFVNIEKIPMSDEEFSKYLLDEVGVATVPGSVFGENGKNYIRLSYAASMQVILEAVERLERAVNKCMGRNG